MHTTIGNKLISSVVGLVRAPGILGIGVGVAAESAASGAVPQPHKLK